MAAAGGFDMSPSWAKTCFQQLQAAEEDAMVVSFPGYAHVGFGDVVAADKYFLWQAAVCDRQATKRAPASMPGKLDWPHMTLLRLDDGWADLEASKGPDHLLWHLIWNLRNVDEGAFSKLNVTTLLEEMNEHLRSTGVLFKVFPGQIWCNRGGHRYEVLGGPALDRYLQAQAWLRSRLTQAGQLASLTFWAEGEGNEAHITFNYEADPITVKLVPTYEDPEFEKEVQNARGPSMEVALKILDDLELGCYKSIFEKEQLSMRVLDTVTADDLLAMGITVLGHRIRILKAFESTTKAAKAAAEHSDQSFASADDDSYHHVPASSSSS